MNQRGYTLIEVLVSSAIFVGILVIGIASFASINRINEKIATQRELAQTGNFVMETLTRDIRTATGVKLPDGTFSGNDYPFDFLNDLGVVDNSGTQMGSLETLNCDSDQVACKTDIYKVKTISGSSFQTLFVNDVSPLLPDNVAIEDLTFTGFSHQQKLVQPYVSIQFTLVADLKSDVPTKQTFRTTVTSLVYAQ
jgi:prepilin-type N-terminal cleavage/methylation domain-containing protein